MNEPTPSATKSEGSVASAINWMGCLTLLLFWLPVIGPFIAGLVGGVKAGSVKGALLAVFVPGVMIGVMVAAGPLLLGAVIGGLGARLSTQWARRGG